MLYQRIDLHGFGSLSHLMSRSTDWSGNDEPSPIAPLAVARRRRRAVSSKGSWSGGATTASATGLTIPRTG